MFGFSLGCLGACGPFKRPWGGLGELVGGPLGCFGGFLGGSRGVLGVLGGSLEALWGSVGTPGELFGCLGAVRVGRGEHWGGFGDSPGCLGALKESPGEHFEELWGVYGQSCEALVKLKGAFWLSHWLKCLCFTVFYKNAPHRSGKHDLYFSLCPVGSLVV